MSLLLFFDLGAQGIAGGKYHVFPFGENGNYKMTYDARQRPQCVYHDGIIYFAVNADTNSKGKSIPVCTSFDIKTQQFSESIKISDKYSKDHHDGPVIWLDDELKFHILYGWHHEGGHHIKSKEPLTLGRGMTSWEAETNPNDTISYPWVSRVYNGKYICVYRTNEHFSSWTYRLSDDNGKTWTAPSADIVNLDILGGEYTDWSMYTAKALSNDGHYLHLGFIAYDDYKRPRTLEEKSSGRLDKKRQKNPLYNDRRVSYKYNLYYVKVDLRNHEVTNYKGDVLQTPIDWNLANEKCMIWDTQWRGGGVVPTMMVDDNDQVSFLHNISNEQHEDSLDYHYLRLDDGEWMHNRITSSNHEWNSAYIKRANDGSLHAYLIVGKGYFHKRGDMDKHGGGDIEEWISRDNGSSWKKARDIHPKDNQYEGWKYNNIQPVCDADGNLIDGMLLFYGWKDGNNPDAKAFLYIKE